MRECECGCGEKYHDPTGRNRFFNEACRKRAKRREVKRAKMSGSQAACAVGSPPPPRATPPPPAILPTDDYQSHAAERADLMTMALLYARQAIQEGYEVTVLRDGDCAVLRMRPAQEALSIMEAARTAADEVYGRDLPQASKRERERSRLDEFVASRMGGGR